MPATLPAQPVAAAALVAKRLADNADAIDAADAALLRITGEHDVADAVADAEFVRWYVDNVPDLSSTENFAWITGWTSDPDEESLLRLLADAGIKGLLHVSDPPPGFEAPLLLRNPKWVQPFEFFTSMLGVPAAGEADPTRIVAIASPLMFGFMFGDVGHGIVVFAAGLLLSRRVPALRLLIAGGALSIVFGFLFGSVFALENVIEPLWVRPMDDPILMFIVPMTGGAVLLLTGMCLDAFQAYWQHRVRAWWGAVAGLVLCYLALLGSLLEPRLLLLALAGALWFLIGHTLVAGSNRLAALGSAAGELLESLLQLVVNTVSFVRVGAFALAHAGLSIAVVGLAQAPASVVAGVVILVLGNALIIGLEGLVVSIQTTRLVLFEFFVRFLRAEGRPFKPLAPAPPVARGKYRRP
jgi:V/A-type H+-transporting ATPase subunit I